jgi:hypothetical protein
MNSIGKIGLAGMIAGLAAMASTGPAFAITKAECELNGWIWENVPGWGYGCAHKHASAFHVIVRASDGATYQFNNGKIGAPLARSDADARSRSHGAAASEGPPGSRSYPFGHKPE